MAQRPISPAITAAKANEYVIAAGQSNRKEIIGTVEEFEARKAAMKACELLRANINRETRSPRILAELVTHFTAKELPNKTPYTAEVYAGYLKTWISPKWDGHSDQGFLPNVSKPESSCLGPVKIGCARPAGVAGID